MNPILEQKYFIPDVEVRNNPDGRLYLYGSQDEWGSDEYCSKSYRVFSTDDMFHYIDNEMSFEDENEMLYTPDCIEREGKYYLYYCTASRGEFVATSAKPQGPFVHPRQIPPRRICSIYR